jgi:mRNA interferase RelE/StbE
MKYRVELTKPALKHLEDIKDHRIRERLFKRIEQLEEEPALQGKPLRDDLSGLWSVRAIHQRYRIVYKIVDQQVAIVMVIAVGLRREGDRSDIYRIAAQLMRSGRIENI